MRKGKSIIGLNVLTQADGQNLGAVKDLVFDHETNALLALLLSGKDLFGLIDAKIIPFNQVLTIGPNAVMVPSSESVINAHDDARVANIMDRDTKLSGTRITTTDGQDLGTFADLYVDEETGHILGYEVSTGFLADTMSGKRYMVAPDHMTIGRDVALVDPTVATDLETQAHEEPGGLKAVATTVGEKVGGAYDATKEKVTDVYANIATASVEKQMEFVVGKTASRDVIIPADKATMAAPEALPMGASSSAGMLSDPLAPPVGSELATSAAATGAMATPMATDVSSSGEMVDGEVLVRKGEVITQQHAERAVAADILGQLVIAAGGGVAGDALAAGREKMSGVAASGSETAGGMSASAQQHAEQAAIGRPAGREVTAPDGSTIVAPGMTITAGMMQEARMFGKEKELIAAAGLGAASQGAETVKEHAAGMWDSIKEKVADLTGAAHEKKAEYDAQSEQNKINNALGRPTTRVILDQSDNVILNTGDLITNAAVNQARTAGVLDILLDSVYTADPEITPEMLRARESGAAALPTQAQPSGGPITATVAPDQPAQDTPPQGGTPAA